MHLLDDWADYIRALGFVISAYSFVTLVVRFKRNRKSWNQKTIDYWYALLMWSLSGCIFCIQAILLNRPISVGFVFLMAAIFVTGKGVNAKGSWGNNSRAP